MNLQEMMVILVFRSDAPFPRRNEKNLSQKFESDHPKPVSFNPRTDSHEI